MSQGSVVSLRIRRPSGELDVVDSLTAEAGKGFVGDQYFGRRTRQSLFISTAEIGPLGYQPGDLREQVTLDLPSLGELRAGDRFSIGAIPFVVEQPCEPCGHMAAALGEEREAFKAKTDGKRGVFAVPEADGVIRIGDAVSLLEGSTP